MRHRENLLTLKVATTIKTNALSFPPGCVGLSIALDSSNKCAALQRGGDLQVRGKFLQTVSALQK